MTNITTLKKRLMHDPKFKREYEKADADYAIIEVNISQDQVAMRDDVFLRSAQVRQRYGNVSHMWIERRLKGDPSFPRPTYFGRQRFWRVHELVEWERGLASQDRVT